MMDFFLGGGKVGEIDEFFSLSGSKKAGFLEIVAEFDMAKKFWQIGLDKTGEVALANKVAPKAKSAQTGPTAAPVIEDFGSAQRFDVLETILIGRNAQFSAKSLFNGSVKVGAVNASLRKGPFGSVLVLN